MKNIISLLLIIGLFAAASIPLSTRAEATTSTSTSTSTTETLIALMKKLIAYLEQLKEKISNSSNTATTTSSLSSSSGSSGSSLGGGSTNNSGLGGSSLLDLLSLLDSALYSPEWYGSYDTSGVDYAVPGVTQQGSGDAYQYDLGAPELAVPGKSTEASQRVYDEARQAASGAKPLTTSQYGRLGCAFAVATILERVGLSVGNPSNLSYTPNLKGALDQAKGRFTFVGQGQSALEATVPGDVVVSPTAGGKTGHTGICMTSRCTKIASNSSSKQRFIVNYTNIYWLARFGNNTYVYRPGSVSSPTTTGEQNLLQNSNTGTLGGSTGSQEGLSN